MSNTAKQELTPISPSEDNKLPSQESKTFLQNKRERDEATAQKCQECGIEDKDRVLTFSLSNQLMTFIYENMLNPGIDNQIKNDILTLALPNKAICLTICKNCLIKILVTKGLNYLIDILPCQDNKTNNDIPSDKSKQYDSFYKVYWNYFIKQIEVLNESLEKDSAELEQILHKMALHLIINKETAQFQKFRTEMEACKSLLQKDKNAFSELLKNMTKINQIFGELSKIIDKKIKNNINDEKMNQLLTLISQIQSEGEEPSDNNPKKIDIQLGQALKESPKTVTIVNQTNNIGNSLSIGDTDNIVSSYSLNEFKVQSQPKISIETGVKATKKKNYIIKSMNPIHEITPSIPLNTNNTPITQMGVKPMEQASNPLLTNAVNSQNALLNDLQMKINYTNPMQSVITNFGPQIQIQMLQHSLSPQIGIPPQRIFPPMYAPNLFNINQEAINALMMKNIFPPQADNKIQNEINHMYQPNQVFLRGMSFPQYHLDINQFMMQQDKMSQKMNISPNTSAMYDPKTGGINENMNNYMNLRNSYEIAKQNTISNIVNNGENKSN